MTEEELRKELMLYEVFLRVEEEDKEEPEVDEEGAFIMHPGECDDDGNWLWEQDEDGQWHLNGFNQERFDIFVRNAVKYHEEQLRAKYHLEKKSGQD